MTVKKHTAWRVCCAAVALLSVLTFTPLVMPLGVHRPMLLGIPYTLWTSILVTVALVALTYWATQLYPPTDDRRET